MKNNKLIAEFMGLELEETLSKKMVYARHELNNPNKLNDCQTNFYESNELLYHFSWDWLMEVVEKIENLEYVNRMGRFNVHSINFEENYTCYITDIACSKQGNTNVHFIQTEGECKLIATYKAVTEFIKWYNLNK